MTSIPFEVVRVAGVAAEAGAYSHCVRVHRGYSSLYISGQVPLNQEGILVGKGDPVAQTRQVFENLRVVLESAGASLASIVKLSVYMANPEQAPAFVGVRSDYLSPPYPVSTFVFVSSLLNPDWLVEVDAVAAIPTP